MPSLVTLKGRVGTLRNVKSVELVSIPALETCVIPSAFKCVEDVKMENASAFDKKELSEVIEKKENEMEKKRLEEEQKRREERERKRKEKEERQEKEKEERVKKERERKEAEEVAKKRVSISCKSDWDCADKHVGVIVVSDNCCNGESLKELDLSRFEYLREWRVGNECFLYVNEVKLVGMNYLETVVIGEECFRNKQVEKADRHFYLKNCPELKSLKIGRFSFFDYSVCEIENVDALESIEMSTDGWSCTFNSASLELKSIRIHSE